MKPLNPILILFLLVFSISCQPNSKKSQKNEQNNTNYEIRLIPVNTSPKFEEAKLSMLMPELSDRYLESQVPFSYQVDHYQLAAQTLDADIKMCANSAEGQHIHLILNNQPYSAHYTTDFQKTLEDGHYVALSFLSRSYHESLKHQNAYALTQFSVGADDHELVDLSQPHLFYSRPKGTYKGKDTQKILLDFYLVNTTLGKNGNKVKATINGQGFEITEWTPHFIEGLPMGEHTIRLELVDQDGNWIEGPYNRVERKFTLAAE